MKGKGSCKCGTSWRGESRTLLILLCRATHHTSSTKPISHTPYYLCKVMTPPDSCVPCLGQLVGLPIGIPEATSYRRTSTGICLLRSFMHDHRKYPHPHAMYAQRLSVRIRRSGSAGGARIVRKEGARETRRQRGCGVLPRAPRGVCYRSAPLDLQFALIRSAYPCNTLTHSYREGPFFVRRSTISATALE